MLIDTSIKAKKLISYKRAEMKEVLNLKGTTNKYDRTAVNEIVNASCI